MSSLEGDGLRHVKQPAPANFGVEVLFRSTVEREHPSKHDEEDYSERPYVCGETGIFFLLNDLWGHIGRGPTEYLEFLAIDLMDTESEVDNLDVVPIIHDQIFQLQVPVANVLRVQVADPLAHLFEEVLGGLLRDDAFLALVLNVLIKADPAHELLDQVYILGPLKAVDQLTDIGVLQISHARDLPHHRFSLRGIVQLELWINLHSHLTLRLLALRQPHRGIGTLAQCPNLHIVVHFVALVSLPVKRGLIHLGERRIESRFSLRLLDHCLARGDGRGSVCFLFG